MKKLFVFGIMFLVVVLVFGCTSQKQSASIADLSKCEDMNCELMSEGNNKDSCFVERNVCYYKIANKTGNSSICEMTTSRVGMSLYDYGTNVCYKLLAIELKDASICELLKDINDKNECYNNIAWALKDASLCDNINDSNTRNAYRKDTCIDAFKYL